MNLCPLPFPSLPFQRLQFLSGEASKSFHCLQKVAKNFREFGTYQWVTGESGRKKFPAADRPPEAGPERAPGLGVRIELVNCVRFHFLHFPSKGFNFFPARLPKVSIGLQKVAKNFREFGLINGLRANAPEKTFRGRIARRNLTGTSAGNRRPHQTRKLCPSLHRPRAVLARHPARLDRPARKNISLTFVFPKNLSLKSGNWLMSPMTQVRAIAWNDSVTGGDRLKAAVGCTGAVRHFARIPSSIEDAHTAQWRASLEGLVKASCPALCCYSRAAPYGRSVPGADVRRAINDAVLRTKKRVSGVSVEFSRKSTLKAVACPVPRQAR